MKYQRFCGKHFCRQCEQEFDEGVYYVRIDDIDLANWAQVPTTCFSCQEVRVEFLSLTFFIYVQPRFLCFACLVQMTYGEDKICWRCNKEVDLPNVSVGGRVYHPDCYRCRTCKWNAQDKNERLSPTGYCEFCEHEESFA